MVTSLYEVGTISDCTFYYSSSQDTWLSDGSECFSRYNCLSDVCQDGICGASGTFAQDPEENEKVSDVDLAWLWWLIGSLCLVAILIAIACLVFKKKRKRKYELKEAMMRNHMPAGTITGEGYTEV